MFEKAKQRHKNDEYKLLIAKMIDKYMFSKNRNTIENTDFVNQTEKMVLLKVLQEEHIKNYIFYGVRENADRNVLIFYPEKINEEMLEKNYNNMFSIIRIDLPEGITYEHREILSGIMKLGIKREKFGDIVITNSGADIVCLKENSEYLINGLKELKRFKKSKIYLENVENIHKTEQSFIQFSINVSSIRLDNFVSELAKCSRTKAKQLIEQGIVYINYKCEFKESKKINLGDHITIRGKGKFIFDKIEKETRTGRISVSIKKYC